LTQQESNATFAQGEQMTNHKPSLFPIIDPKSNFAAGTFRCRRTARLDRMPRRISATIVTLHFEQGEFERHLPFNYAINRCRGCEFARRYCYARYAYEFLELTPEEFEHKIYFRESAAWLITQEQFKSLSALQPTLISPSDESSLLPIPCLMCLRGLAVLRWESSPNRLCRR
jgi:hypothetical protein